jgi:hypothetical protein
LKFEDFFFIAKAAEDGSSPPPHLTISESCSFWDEVGLPPTVPAPIIYLLLFFLIITSFYPLVLFPF